MATAGRETVFTCTFCYGLAAGRPRLIGHGQRLSCGGCHAALLDLAICWVCGELVLRGDECASLGWCFWHRTCYGCLLCGSRAVTRGPAVAALYADGAAGAAARELAEPPLCASCLAEIDADRLDADEVLRRGLRRTDARDGGLTRQRREATAATTVYVSSADPLAGPAFSPAPTKPLPAWMAPRWCAPRPAASPPTTPRPLRRGASLISLQSLRLPSQWCPSRPEPAWSSPSTPAATPRPWASPQLLAAQSREYLARYQPATAAAVPVDSPGHTMVDRIRRNSRAAVSAAVVARETAHAGTRNATESVRGAAERRAVVTRLRDEVRTEREA